MMSLIRDILSILGDTLKSVFLESGGATSPFYYEIYRYSNWLSCIREGNVDHHLPRHFFCKSLPDITNVRGDPNTWQQFLHTAEEYVRRNA